LENAFIVVYEQFGKQSALRFMKTLMEYNLKEAYERMGFTKGNLKDFCRLMNERDKAVGLHIQCYVKNDRIYYTFFDRLFDRWKGLVSDEEAIGTFMDFKVHYLLGKDYSWTLKQHFWRGDDRISVEIFKEKA